MKKIYVSPRMVAVSVVVEQLLNSNSIEVHEKESDPLVDDPDRVYSRRDDRDVWADEEEEDDYGSSAGW